MAYSGPLVQLETSFTRLPWRLAPVWAVIAGAVAGGLSFVGPGQLARLLGAVVLADVVWGMVRHYAEHAVIKAPARIPALLPYATDDGPLARTLAALTLPGREDRAGWQGAATGLLFSAALSVLLGWPAALISCAALVTMWIAWLVRARGEVPALAGALLDVGWPAVLGVSLSGIPVLPTLWVLLAGMAAFVFLQWGLLRQVRAGLAVGWGRSLAILMWAALLGAALVLRF